MAATYPQTLRSHSCYEVTALSSAFHFQYLTYHVSFLLLSLMPQRSCAVNTHFLFSCEQIQMVKELPYSEDNMFFPIKILVAVENLLHNLTSQGSLHIIAEVLTF